MAWALRKYHMPDFTQDRFLHAPEAKLREAPADQVAPPDFHAMSIFRNISRSAENGFWQRKAGWTVFRFTVTEKSLSVNPDD